MISVSLLFCSHSRLNGQKQRKDSWNHVQRCSISRCGKHKAAASSLYWSSSICSYLLILSEHATTPGSVINHGFINNRMILHPYIWPGQCTWKNCLRLELNSRIWYAWLVSSPDPTLSRGARGLVTRLMHDIRTNIQHDECHVTIITSVLEVLRLCGWSRSPGQGRRTMSDYPQNAS